MTAVERFEVGFKAGQVWLESSTGIMRTITEVLTDGRICYASCYPSADHANKRKLVGPQMECIQDWHDDYRLLTPDAPNCDLLTALEEQIEALTARVDALERPAETEPTPPKPHCVPGVPCDVNDCFYCPNIPRQPVKVETQPPKPEPTPDAPRDCTGREVSRDQVVAYGTALFYVTDSLIPRCILPNDGWYTGQEASFIAADWAECRILWPLAEEGTEGKR